MFNKPTFGTNTPGTSSFGFGSPTANNGGPFGNTSLFGKPSTSNFGQQPTTFGQPTSSLFPSAPNNGTALFPSSNATAFGTPTTSQTTFGSGLFGQQQQQPAANNIFGSSNFGQQTKPFGFGAQTPSQTNLFGSSQQQPSLFQPSGSSNIFGTSTFGSSSAIGVTGTGAVKFNPVTGTDTMQKSGVSTSISTKHHCITCMKEYESKSLEELRFEDYQANRKGPTAPAPFGASPFGGTQPTVPMFGQTENKPAFGTNTGFGQQTIGGFGTSTSGFGLGTQTTTNRGVFGNQTQGFGTLGSTNTTFGAFGTNNTGTSAFSSAQNKPFGTTTTPLFGNNQNQQQTSSFGSGTLFGQNTQPTNGGFFGKPAQTTFGTGSSFSFGAQQPTATQSSTNVFQSKPMFGLTQSQSAPTFGTNNGFGQTTQSAFGNNAFNKPLTFNQPQNNYNLGQTNLFPSNQQKPSLFGTGNTGTGLFGNTSFQNSSLFPSSQPLTQPQTELFPQQNGNESKDVSLLSSNQFGRSAYLSGLQPINKTSEIPPLYTTNPDEIKKVLSPGNQIERSVNKRPPLKIGTYRSERDALFDVADRPNPSQEKLSFKKLVIKKKPEENREDINRSDYKSLIMSPEVSTTTLSTVYTNKDFGTSSTSDLATPIGKSLENLSQSLINGSNHDSNTKPAGDLVKRRIGFGIDPSEEEIEKFEAENSVEFANAQGDKASKGRRCGIILTRSEYYTLPSLNELDQLVGDDGKCIVKGFTIGRKGYGNVYFPDEMDVANLNLDEILYFRYRELVIYPDDKKKPALGEGLNRPAQVTLDKVYPRVKETREIIDDPDQILASGFPEQLVKVSYKRGIKFLDYIPETGSWVFLVSHFSKYAFTESDDEDCELTAAKAEPKKLDKIIDKMEKPKFPITRPKAMVDTDDVNSMCTDEDQCETDILHKSMAIDLQEEKDMSMYSDMHFNFGGDGDMYGRNAVQLMKATFFPEMEQDSYSSVEDEEEDLEDEEDEIPIVLDKEDLFDKRKLQMYPKRPSIRPKLRTVMMYRDSSPNYSQIRSMRCYCDLGAFKINSFRVGWSRGFEMYNLNYNTTSDRRNYRGLNLVTLPELETSEIFTETIRKAIDVTVQFSKVENPNQFDKMPTFSIEEGRKYLLEMNVIFEKAFNMSPRNEESLYHDVFSLCYALWGPGRKTNPFVKARVSTWLKKSIMKDSKIDPSEFRYQSLDKKIKAIFDLLTCYNTNEAANLAMQSNLLNLSMIISQVMLSPKPRTMLEEQLETWYRNLSTDHIEDDLLKIYLLLGGKNFRNSINVCEDLDWKKALGIHLWYIVPAASQLQSVIQAYNDGFEVLKYAASPNPPYNKEKKDVYNILYHILVLYQNGTHQLSKVLSLFTYSSSETDYRLSWLLLHLFKFLNIGSVDKCEEDHIHMSFSSQLESLGLWCDGVFPLLFLSNEMLKKNLVTKLLERNLSTSSDEETKKIEEKLVKEYHLPASLIHEIKAEKCYQQEKYWLAFSHFLHAKNWIKSNQIFVEFILPKLFAQNKETEIRYLIKGFAPGKHLISNWSSELGLVEDIYEVEEKFKTAKGNSELLQLQKELIAICYQLKKFPSFNVHHKLCIADLSKRCMIMYQGLEAQMEKVCLRPSLEDLFEWFVMPPDYVTIACNGYVKQLSV